MGDMSAKSISKKYDLTSLANDIRNISSMKCVAAQLELS